MLPRPEGADEARRLRFTTQSERALSTAKAKSPKFEPKNIIDTSSRNRAFAIIRPILCNILELVRTHFAAEGGEEVSPRKFEKAAEPHR